MSSSANTEDLYQHDADTTLNDNDVTGNKTASDTKPIVPSIQLGEISPLHMEESCQANKENAETLKIIIISSVVFSVAVLISLIVSIIYSPPQTTGFSKAVVSDSHYCSSIGGDVLDNGGNALDAAVASCFCECVVSMHITGLGGSGLLVVRRKEQKDSKSFNFISTTPESEFEVVKDQVGSTVGVPGLVHGLYTAHTMYGSKKWKDVVDPAIKLARDGFIISKELSEYLALLPASDLNSLTSSSNTSQGQTVTLIPLADTLQLIADNQLSDFYAGSIRDEIIKQVNENGGKMIESDFTNYETLATDTVSTSYKDMIVETTPLPSSGPILAFILNVLDTFKVTSEDFKDFLLVHKLIEVVKYGMGNMYTIGDSAQANSDIQNMLSSENTASVSSSIRNKTQPWSSYSSQPEFKTSEIRGSHVIIKDSKSNYVSVVTSLGDTSTIKLVAAGFLLNDALSVFVNGSKNNEKASKRRPAFYLAPAVIHSDDRPCGIEAALSGSVNAVSVPDMAQVIVRLLAYKMNITDAISVNRFQFPLQLGNVTYDGKVSQEMLKSLQGRGHYPSPSTPRYMDHVCGVSYINDTVVAGIDYRGHGSQDVR